MLKINLLPEQKRVKVYNVEKEIILFVLIIALILIGCGYTQMWITGVVNKLQTTKQQKVMQKTKLLQKVNKVKEIEEKIDKTKRKIQVIKDIRTRQSLPVEYINALVVNIPENKIWFNTLTLDNNMLINLDGIALDNQIYAQFAQNLRRSPLIKNINLKKTSKQEFENLELIAFDCTIQAGTRKESGEKQ